MLSIGDLSRHTQVKIPTIRFYEEKGLIDDPVRSNGNQRRYEQSDLDRLMFIRHARALGLTLGEIRELIALNDHPDQPCEGADRIAADHLALVKDKIAQLRKLEKELKRISSQCNSGTIKDCYVIRSLANHALCSHEH
jgi:DNA-binding transcriptional MerR regulator